MRSLTTGREQGSQRPEALTPQRLLMLAVKDDDLHDQILMLAE
jgi:hypothetical protein